VPCLLSTILLPPNILSPHVNRSLREFHIDRPCSLSRALSRFWYLNDATGAIPDHVHARESMQVSVCRSHVYLYAYATCCLDLCVFSFLHYTLPSPFAGCLFGVLLLSPFASALVSHPFGDSSHALGTHLTTVFACGRVALRIQ
jgi:hypothetical protein